jgi:hypothetical protein
VTKEEAIALLSKPYKEMTRSERLKAKQAFNLIKTVLAPL